MNVSTTTRTEWRVVIAYPRHMNRGPFSETFHSEADAHEWATEEKAEYPYVSVTVESREVGPWTPREAVA